MLGKCVHQHLKIFGKDKVFLLSLNRMGWEGKRFLFVVCGASEECRVFRSIIIIRI